MVKYNFIKIYTQKKTPQNLFISSQPNSNRYHFAHHRNNKQKYRYHIYTLENHIQALKPTLE